MVDMVDAVNMANERTGRRSTFRPAKPPVIVAGAMAARPGAEPAA